MSFALLAPIGLTALAALALPLLIHLVRRIELRTTVFAALRWISERIRPRRRLRFERPWLLLLRLALLALLALLLARPVIDEPTVAKPAWVLVAPGTDLGAARAAVSITGAEWRWLAPGFPAIETPAPSGALPIASLLREIDGDLPRDAQLAVVVPEQVAGLDGERPRLSRAIEWHVVPGRMSAAPALPERETVEWSVRYAPSAESRVAYLRAAIAALNARGMGHYKLDAQRDNVPLAATVRELVWLGSAPSQAVTAWIEAGGTALVDSAPVDTTLVDTRPRAPGAPIWRDADGNVLAGVQALGHGRLVTLAAALSPDSFPRVLDADFPQHLLELLQGSPAAPALASADALRPSTTPSGTEHSARLASTKPLDPWLALLIAVLILVERIVATRSPERR
ncbi:MAG TPA: BatA domain-containing protein [Rhodanobacteraceae bacterium]|jgi:hypothetical protein|nr:BatA domain-containing protein [Rhodanobacteraceae bacterium]